MERRQLGRTGIMVTPLGFGSQTIGGLGEDSQPTADAYLQAGGRLIDTARGYGVSEIYVGKAVKMFPQGGEVTICSKSGATHPPIIRADMEVSRFCIQRDKIDVYCVHVPPKDFDQLRRILDCYEQFRNEGKVRYIGVSQADPNVAATIPGAGSPEEMQDNLSVNALPPMPAKMFAELTAASRGLLALMRSRV